MAAYSKCNFLQLQPFEKPVTVNITIRQESLVIGKHIQKLVRGQQRSQKLISRFIWKFGLRVY